MITELNNEYKVALGVIGFFAAFPTYKIAKFLINSIITLLSPRKGTKLASSFAFFDLFAPDGTRRLLEQIIDKEGNLKTKISEFGPHLDGKSTYLINDAEEFRDLLQTEKFPKLEIVYDSLDILLGNGLVLSKGDLWKRQRRLLTPLFHFKNLSKMPKIMNHRILQFLSSLEANPGKEWNAAEIFGKLTLRIVIDCVFGGEDYFDAEEMAPRWDDVNKAFNNFFLTSILFGKTLNSWMPFPWNIKLYYNINKIKKDVQKAIEKKRNELNKSNYNNNKNNNENNENKEEEEEGKDLMTSLLSVRDDVTGEGIPDSLIIDEALTFLFAGHDTTSSLLAFAMTFISRDGGEIATKIRNEVQNVVGDRLPDYSDLPLLSYTSHVAKETLRMRPPVPLLDRRSAEKCSISGTPFPAHTYIYPNLIAAHYDNRYWVDPFKFNPDRFEDKSIDRNPYSFVPFSAHSRNCIGQKFALMEATLVLAILISRFDVISYTKPEDDCWHFEGTMKPVHFKCSFVPVNKN